MLAHVFTQLIVMVVQVGLLLVFALVVFKVGKEMKFSLSLQIVHYNKSEILNYKNVSAEKKPDFHREKNLHSSKHLIQFQNLRVNTVGTKEIAEY